MGVSSWVLVVGLAWASIPASGRAAPGPDRAAETGGIGVEPIASRELGEEADRTRTQLQGIKARVERGPSLGVIEREFPRISERIAELDSDMPSRALEVLSERELEDLTFTWRQAARQARKLQRLLGDESDRFASELQRVESIRERWAVTAESTDLMPAATEQATLIRRAAKTTATQIRSHLDTIHDAQARVSGTAQIATQRVAELAAARESQRSKILTRGDALWHVDPRVGASPVGLVVRTMRRQVDQLAVFLSEGAGSLLVLLTTWLLAWWTLVVLGRMPADRGPEGSLGVESSLTRPRSAALLLAIGSFALLGPPMPWALRQAMWLLSLPALLRVLTPTPYRSIALVFTGPLLLSLSSEIVPLSSEWARYLHLLVSASGLLAALWVGRWHRNETLRGLRLGAMRLAEVLLALSIVANVAGYGALAPVLNYATMFGIYLAVLIIALVGVCRALVRMGVKTEVLRRSHAIRSHGDAIATRMLRYLVLGAWVIWVVAVADGFGVAEPLWTSLELWMEAPWEIGAFAVTPMDLLAFGLTLYAALLTSRLLGFVLEEDVLPRLDLARGLPPTISMLLRYLVLAVGFIIATVAAGVQLDKLSLLVGAFGVGIGFGLQNVVNNFVSGLILMFERPVKVGDTIEVGALLGQVTRIGLRASTVRTLQGAEVIIPNANLISEAVTNWTLSDRRRRFEVDVGVAYGTDPERVIELLTDVARSNPRVLTNPEPAAWFSGFGQSSLDFQLLSWTPDFDDWRGVRSELTVAVARALAEANIPIPFPQRDLHLRSADSGLVERMQGRPEPLPPTCDEP